MESSERSIESLISNFVWRGVRLGDHPHLRTRVFAVDGDSLVLQSEDSPKRLVIPRDSASLISTAFQTDSYIAFQNARGSRDLALETSIGSVLAFRLGRAAAAFAVVCIDSRREEMFGDDVLTHIQLLAALLEYFGSPFLIFNEAQARASAALGTYLGWVRKWLARQHTSLPRGTPTSWQLLRWEQGLETPSEQRALEWCYALGVLAHPRVPIVNLIEDITPEFLKFLQEDPQRLQHITPEQFEHLAAERLDRMGFTVTLTGATTHRDGGVDIVAAKRDPALGNFLIAAQVKHHRGDQKTGREAVDRLVSLKGGVFNFGLLVTNTFFTRDAQWVAAQGNNQYFVRLRDFADVKRWLEENFSGDRDYNEVPDEIELSPGVRIKIPRPDFAKLKVD